MTEIRGAASKGVGETETDQASGSERLPAPTRRFGARHRRRTVAAAVVAGFVAVGTAATAGGGFSPGDVIPAGEPSPPPESRLSVDETVLATGTTPIAGPWRLTAYESEESAGQPAGLPCIRLLLQAPPAGTPLAGSGFCGKPDEGGFSAASVPVRDKSGASELIVFGIAPDQASSVHLTSDGGSRASARTRDAAADNVTGKVWVMTVPSGVRDGEIEWVDSSGQASATKQDASGFFDRLEAVEGIVEKKR